MLAFSLTIACGAPEAPYKVELDDYAVPEFKYGRPPGWMDWRRQHRNRASSDLARKFSYARIRALRSGNFRQKGRGIRIGVFDTDQNRVFNDPGVDYVTVGPFAADTLPVFECVASVPQRKLPFVVSVEDQHFQIDSIATDGTALWVTPVPTADSCLAYVPTRIPDIPFTTIDGDTARLADFLEKDKFLYVECWSTWFQAAIDGLPELKAAYVRFKEDLNVVHLVMNEVDYSRVRGHMERYDLPWVQGIFTEAMGRALMQNSIPYGILVAPDGSIVKMGLGPGELEPFLASIL